MDRRMTVGNEIAGIVAGLLGKPGDLVTCEKRTQDNGIEKMGIRVMPAHFDAMSAVPFFNIDSAVDGVIEGTVTKEEAGKKIAEAAASCKGAETLDASIDRDYILRECRTKVLSAQKNSRMLHDKPFRLICDLVELVIIPVSIGGGEKNGFITAEFGLMDRYGITEEELFAAARKNVSRHVVFTGLEGIIGYEGGGLLYVVTNEDNLYGASLVACPEILSGCMEALGGGVFIIPSSVHEVLLCRKSDCDDAASLLDIIKMVNENVVDPEEVLSGHLYSATEDGRLYIVS